MRMMTYVALACSVVLVILRVILCLTKQSQVDLGNDNLPGMKPENRGFAADDHGMELEQSSVPYMDDAKSVESTKGPNS